MFKIIVCVNTNMCIGNADGSLLYRIKSDLKNFKRMTVNNVVIMGRKTYESIGKALPNRVNIVLTSDKSINDNNVVVVHSIEEAISICKEKYPNKEWFVIGGGTVYKQFLDKNIVDTMYITEVSDTKDGDVFFPNVLVGDDCWTPFYVSDTQKDRENNLNYFFSIYKKTCVN